jgi:rhodanese-related sulfurtransferase
MLKNIKFHSCFSAALFYILFGCSEKIMVKNVNPLQVRGEVDSGQDILLLDVRTEAEFNGPLGHIENALLIPVQELPNRIGELEKFKDRTIIVYCRSGRRSEQASQILLEHGFKNVQNMTGGINSWNELYK